MIHDILHTLTLYVQVDVSDVNLDEGLEFAQLRRLLQLIASRNLKREGVNFENTLRQIQRAYQENVSQTTQHRLTQAQRETAESSNQSSDGEHLAPDSSSQSLESGKAEQLDAQDIDYYKLSYLKAQQAQTTVLTKIQEEEGEDSNSMNESYASRGSGQFNSVVLERKNPLEDIIEEQSPNKQVFDSIDLTKPLDQFDSLAV